MHYAKSVRQFMYFLMAFPIGYAAFSFVDWYWFDDKYYPVVAAAITESLSRFW